MKPEAFEEVRKNPDEELPQIDAVFDLPALDFDSHKWLQEGYFLIDHCVPQTGVCYQGAIPIPTGKMLMYTGGKYELINE